MAVSCQLLVIQWAEMHSISVGSCGLANSSRPNACQLWRQRLPSMAFMGLPSPTDRTGRHSVTGNVSLVNEADEVLDVSGMGVQVLGRTPAATKCRPDSFAKMTDGPVN